MAGIALLVLGVGACAHGPRLITEEQMRDPSEVAAIANKQVKTRINMKQPVMKVAIIGINSWRVVGQQHHGHYSRWDPTAGTRETIDGQVQMAHAISDASKFVTCRALDSIFDSLLPAIQAVGLQAVPVADKIGPSALGRRAENQRGSVACVADKARVSPMSWVGLGFADAFGGRHFLPEFQQDMGTFMTEVGVDGVLMAILGSDDALGPEATTLVLFVKRPDGVVELGWEGHMQDKKIRFEPVISKPSNDEERIQNIGRVYHHTFELMAAKLVTDSRK